MKNDGNNILRISIMAILETYGTATVASRSKIGQVVYISQDYGKLVDELTSKLSELLNK